MLVAICLGLLIGAVVFGKSKSKWRPFGGLLKHDRKTGQVSVVLTLPGKGSKTKRRKR